MRGQGDLKRYMMNKKRAIESNRKKVKEEIEGLENLIGDISIKPDKDGKHLRYYIKSSFRALKKKAKERNCLNRLQAIRSNSIFEDLDKEYLNGVFNFRNPIHVLIVWVDMYSEKELSETQAIINELKQEELENETRSSC